jgi:hypothetical protein
MDRLYVVKRPFTAKTAWVCSTPRIFGLGETLWWDEQGDFKVDGFRWHPDDSVQFSQSIEPFESSLQPHSVWNNSQR